MASDFRLAKNSANCCFLSFFPSDLGFVSFDADAENREKNVVMINDHGHSVDFVTMKMMMMMMMLLIGAHPAVAWARWLPV